MFFFLPIAVLGVFALYVNSRPSAFRIARSRTIDAPPAAVFARLRDFREWSAWSPWEQLDPTMKKTYEGAASGKGAVYRWTGNKQVGEGVMTLLDETPDQRVEIQLQFIKPFAATNKAIFTLEPKGAATDVTWAMEGNNGFMQKAFGVFMNMDEMIGKDFVRGLDALAKTVAPR